MPERSFFFHGLVCDRLYDPLAQKPELPRRSAFEDLTTSPRRAAQKCRGGPGGAGAARGQGPRARAGAGRAGEQQNLDKTMSWRPMDCF